MEGESETRMGGNGWRTEKDVYYAGRDEGRKRKGRLWGLDDFPGGTLPRGAKPCRLRRQGGKEKAGKRAKSVYVLYA